MFFLNKIFLGIVAGVVAIGGLVGISTKSHSPKIDNATSSAVRQDDRVSVSASSTKEWGGKGNGIVRKTAPLSELIHTETPAVCTYASSTKMSMTTGTVYVGNGKLYAEVNAAPTDTNSVGGHMNIIFDESAIYMWSSLSTKGIKIAATGEGWGSEAQITSSLQATWKQSNAYECKPWTVDGAKFVPPTTIQFVDFAQQLQQSIQQGLKNLKPAAH